MSIEYTVKHNKRSRRIRIAVRGDGCVVVSAPKRIGERRLSMIIQEHTPWIERTIAKHKKRIAGVNIEKETFDHEEFKSAVENVVNGRYSSIAAPQGIGLGRISIKKMSSRWGSCSFRGNIAVNLLLGHLPDRLLEYVAVHEVCHLVHHNHSPRFWSLVASNLPDHRERRRELRRFGHLLASANGQ